MICDVGACSVRDIKPQYFGCIKIDAGSEYYLVVITINIFYGSPFFASVQVGYTDTGVVAWSAVFVIDISAD